MPGPGFPGGYPGPGVPGGGFFGPGPGQPPYSPYSPYPPQFPQAAGQPSPWAPPPQGGYGDPFGPYAAQPPGWAPGQPFQPYLSPPPRQPWARLTIGLSAIGALVGAVLVIVLHAHGSGTAASANTSASGSGSAGNSSSPGGSASSSNGASVPGNASSGTYTAKVGSGISLAGIDAGEQMIVTVTKLDTNAEPIDDFNTAPAGDRLYAVELTLKDTGSEAYSDAPGNSATIFDSAGHSYKTQFDEVTDCDAFPAVDNIPAGSADSGCVVFEVPKASKITKVQFILDSGYGPQTGVWKAG